MKIHNYGLATRLRGTKIDIIHQYTRNTRSILCPHAHPKIMVQQSNYHNCEEARQALYNSIIDSNGSIDVMTPKSDKASSRMSQAVKLLVDYIIVQHQSYNGVYNSNPLLKHLSISICM